MSLQFLVSPSHFLQAGYQPHRKKGATSGGLIRQGHDPTKSEGELRLSAADKKK
jgi:hypothetical protein